MAIGHRAMTRTAVAVHSPFLPSFTQRDQASRRGVLIIGHGGQQERIMIGAYASTRPNFIHTTTIEIVK